MPLLPRYRSFRDIDWTLLVIVLAICAVGVLQIYSVTKDDSKLEELWWRQLVWIGMSLAVLWVATTIDYHTLLGQVPILYTAAVVGLLATAALGEVRFGSRRWLSVLGQDFQVSEFAKVVIVLVVARYLSELKRDEITIRDLLKLGGLVGIPTVLVMRQPDLGTSLTYVAITGAGILLAGIRWRYLAAIAVVCGLALPAAWPLLGDYQKNRITSFLDPWSDPLGTGWNVIQSQIAVGHGGMWGTDAGQGTQAQLQFLPVPHADFIFSAFAEQHGFVGVVIMLGLFCLLVMQVVQNAQTAPDRSGMYICMGVATVLLFHILVNIGMGVGSMIVTGIPLPLMSAGGSNLLTVFVMLGLVNNVRLRRFAS